MEVADDFWGNLLAGAQPAAPTRVEGPPQERPWWQYATVDTPPVNQPAPVAASPPPDAGADSLRRAQWAKQPADSCPNCASSSYSAHPEYPNAKKRCFECGYPIMQSGSGAAVQGDQAGPVKEARQLAESRTSNFNPRHIVQHMHPQAQ